MLLQVCIYNVGIIRDCDRMIVGFTSTYTISAFTYIVVNMIPPRQGIMHLL